MVSHRKETKEFDIYTGEHHYFRVGSDSLQQILDGKDPDKKLFHKIWASIKPNDESRESMPADHTRTADVFAIYREITGKDARFEVQGDLLKFVTQDETSEEEADETEEAVEAETAEA